MRCDTAVELVTEYLEDALRPSRRRQFRRHLAACRHCLVYLVQMRATIRLTSRVQVAGKCLSRPLLDADDIKPRRGNR